VPAWRLASGPDGKALKGERDVYLDGAYRSVPVHDRGRLRPHACVGGPAIVEERESTVLVTGRFDLTVDEALNIVLRRTMA
jgi:N-methylhydantoinase A